MRKRPVTILVVVTVIVLSAACNGGDNNNTSTTPRPSTTVALAGPIEVIGKWGGDEQNKFQEVINAFQERTPGANVRYKSAGDEVSRVLEQRIDSLPDVAILPQPGLLQQLANQKILKSVEPLVGRMVDENYGALWRELGTVQGVLYGVWFKATNKSTIWYPTRLFSGISTPGSWEELLKVAANFSSSGVTPFSVAGADAWTLTDWFENVYLRTAGPELYDKLTRREIPWTHDSVREALTKLGAIFAPEWLAGGTAGALSTNFERSVVQVFGETPPRAAMVYEGDAVAGVIREKTRAQVGADASYFPFPAIRGSKTSVVAGGDIAVLLSDNPVAKEFIRFLATPEAAEPWARAGGFASPNKKLSLDTYSLASARQTAAALMTSDVVRFDLSDLQPAAFGATRDQGMWKILQDFLATPSSVDNTARQLEAARAVARF